MHFYFPEHEEQRAINEYAVNGSVDWKSMLVYTGAGIFKGMAGNTATAYLQGIIGSDRRLVNKGIGLVCASRSL